MFLIKNYEDVVSKKKQRRLKTELEAKLKIG